MGHIDCKNTELSAEMNPFSYRQILTKKDFIILVQAFLLPVIWLMCIRAGMLSNGECSLDTFYHAKIAKMGPKVFLAKEFPWTEISVWGKHFADKEMGYHLLIWMFFNFQRLFGIVLEPPFHITALMFLLCLQISYLFLCIRLKIQPLFILCGSFLFYFLAPNCTYRLLMLRPHILSLTIFMITCGILAGSTLRFRMRMIFFISVLYSWSYSNPHFIVIPTLIFSVFYIRKDGLKSLFLPLISLVGVFLALLIHPQFPNSFLIWKIQSWDALISPMIHQGTWPKPTEMLPPSFHWQLRVIPMYLMTFSELMMIIRIAEKKGLKQIPQNSASLFLLAVLFTCGIFISARSIEYAGPFVALSFISLINDLQSEKMLYRFFEKKKVLLFSVLVLTIQFVFYSSPLVYKSGIRSEIHPIPQLAEWMKKNISPETQIVNIDWSDFPKLFYYDDIHHYQWGMDPMFAICENPKLVNLLTSAMPNTRMIIPGGTKTIGASFHTKYAVLLWPRKQQAMFLQRLGQKPVQTFVDKGKEEGWIFQL